MGLRKQKSMIRKKNPDQKLISCPTAECPMLDCESDVVDLDLIEETVDHAHWHGTCRLCKASLTLIMDKRV